MSKCYYHGKTEAVSACLGCKLPVCATCRDEGAKGLCDQCVRKQASLVEPVRGPKPVAERPSASPRVASGRGAQQRADIVYCFRHDDIRASSACATCDRPYCPACLNTSGVCGVCARVNRDAQAMAFNPNERGRAVLEEVAAAKAAKRLKPRDYAVVAVLLIGVGVSYKSMTAKPPRVDAARETLARSKTNQLSAGDMALLASLQREKRVTLKDPVPAAGGAAGGAAAVGGVSGGAAAAGGGAPTGGGSTEALEIRALYPADGAIVGGTASIRAAIAGAPSRVVCEVDGTVVGSSGGSAPRFSWNTRQAGNGPHSVTVTAFSAAGSTSASVTLNVLNR